MAALWDYILCITLQIVATNDSLIVVFRLFLRACLLILLLFVIGKFGFMTNVLVSDLLLCSGFCHLRR